ncbi:DUF3987 domain-containing protein [Nevskia ramosa]|uniref:DUF3987 domain-containing protein n=1 Tax=Nevskia ramosa TaxID=64002 RepID=UPI0003B73327|nr:DUF3987 domain-containing protein [Nevskia ramosa]
MTLDLGLSDAPGALSQETIEVANIANLANIQQRRGFAAAKVAANRARTLAEDAAESESDYVIPPPAVDPAMFYGPLGRLARQAAEGTEVNPVAAMAAAMSWLSACMGRNRAIAIGDEWHHLRLFTLHVGRSSRGGKGMALGLLKRVIAAIGKLDDATTLRPQMHTGGLSSREGLAVLIHDGYTEGKTEYPPIVDKRLFIVESEFANVLAQGKRDGNTLSTCLRDVWDGSAIKPATKSSQVWASRPHIALHGCITPTELRAKLASNDLSNGFANRFLMVWGERTGVIPFPSRASDATVHELAKLFAAIIRHGLAGYPDATETCPLRMSRTALSLYADCYREFAKPHPGGELIGGLLQRRAPMLLRMAGLFAVTDLADEIDRGHVEAAQAWMTYFAQSAQMIFAPAVDVEGEAHRNDDAEKLAAWLILKDGWQSRKDITSKCFQGHTAKPVIDEALERLALEARIERREIDGGGPRKRTEYRIKQAQPDVSRSKFARSSQLSSQAETLAVIECSQQSQCSQAATAESEKADADEIVEGWL